MSSDLVKLLREQGRWYVDNDYNLPMKAARRIEMLEAAIQDWNERTEWVQQTSLPHELGLHRADVLRQRIESRDAEIERLRAKVERGASAFTYVEGTAYPAGKITKKDTTHD